MNEATPQPSPDVGRLGARRVELESELKQVRMSLASVIRGDAARGIRQVDLVRDSQYTREQLRRICDKPDVA
jgi:hypothetical protein